MKESWKMVGKIAVIATGVLAVGYWIYRETKKNFKHLETEDRKAKEILKAQGITEEMIDRQIVEDLESKEQSEENDNGRPVEEQAVEKVRRRFVRETFTRMWREWADSPEREQAIHFRRVRRSKTERVVHLVQRFDVRSQREVLDIMFEIPVGSDVNIRGKKATFYNRDYNAETFIEKLYGSNRPNEHGVKVREIGEVAKELEKIARENTTIKVKNGEYLLGIKIEGYYLIAWDEKYYNPGEDEDPEVFPRSAWKKIDKEDWRDKGYFGITPYVSDIKYKYCRNEKGEKCHLEVESPSKDCDGYCRVVDAIAVVNMTFAIQDGTHLDGIDNKTAIDICDYIIEELSIPAENPRNDDFRYEYILFHCEHEDDDDEEMVWGIELEEVSGKTKKVIRKCIYYPQLPEDIEKMKEDEAFDQFDDNLEQFE